MHIGDLITIDLADDKQGTTVRVTPAGTKVIEEATV